MWAAWLRRARLNRTPACQEICPSSACLSTRTGLASRYALLTLAHPAIQPYTLNPKHLAFPEHLCCLALHMVRHKSGPVWGPML